MWVRIFFFNDDKPSILGAVGLDGNVYFRASDVGRFLGYRSNYKFALRYGTKNLLDFLPLDYLPKNYKIYKHGIRVLDFVDMITTIRKTFGKHKLPFDEKDISRLTALWYFGSVESSRSDSPSSLLNSSKYAKCLYVKPGDKTCMSVQEWFRQFVKNSFIEKYSNGSVLSNYSSKKRKNDDDEQHETFKRACLESFAPPPPFVNNISNLPQPDSLQSPVDVLPQPDSSQSFVNNISNLQVDPSQSFVDISNLHVDPSLPSVDVSNLDPSQSFVDISNVDPSPPSVDVLSEPNSSPPSVDISNLDADPSPPPPPPQSVDISNLHVDPPPSVDVLTQPDYIKMNYSVVCDKILQFLYKHSNTSLSIKDIYTHIGCDKKTTNRCLYNLQKAGFVLKTRESNPPMWRCIKSWMLD